MAIAYTEKSLGEMKMPQLRQIAADLGVKNYRRKADMIVVILAATHKRALHCINMGAKGKGGLTDGEVQLRNRIQEACLRAKEALDDAKAEDLRTQLKAGLITRRQRRDALNGCSGMFEHNHAEIVAAANKLGITITKAQPGTEIYQCWADRVANIEQAVVHGQAHELADMIADANAYAVK